jgi:hypothetical protein
MSAMFELPISSETLTEEEVNELSGLHPQKRSSRVVDEKRMGIFPEPGRHTKGRATVRQAADGRHKPRSTRHAGSRRLAVRCL